VTSKLETSLYWRRRAVEAWELSQRYAQEARVFEGFARDAEQEHRAEVEVTEE
jgi:hypothetical protein